eukprot:2584851-Lingulodinium_polyedra.AAC.1
MGGSALQPGGLPVPLRAPPPRWPSAAPPSRAAAATICPARPSPGTPTVLAPRPPSPGRGRRRRPGLSP